MSPLTQPESDSASPRFLEVAQQLADTLKLDVVRVARGDPMVFKGLEFWLQHHGPLDPHGFVLAVQVGACDEGAKAFLRHHYRTPAGVTGYYAMLPDRDVIVYCTRLDYDRTAQPVDTILSVVQLTADCLAAQRDATPSRAEPVAGASC